ncbi:tripartite tricarboxylate transporter substrate binding protein [Diaphorobacter sp. NR2-3-3-1]|nr:tripartite tricarboxylate transporter substrate binding protein [Diaphorobacter caeni]
MNKRNSRRALLTLATAMVGCGIAPAVWAQGAYPDKPIRLIVPFPPGGGADRVARTLTQKLTQTMKTSFVVENRGGGNGTIALDAVAKAPADGYTLGLTLTDHLALNPALFDRLPYDGARDLAPVALIASYPFIFAVNPSSGPATMAKALESATAAPDAVSVGFPSANSRLAIEQLQRRAKVQLNQIPYRGIAQGLPDLIGGRITFWIGTSATLRAPIEGKQVRGLAVTSAKRLPALPDIPTVSELGFPDYETVSWYGLLAPAKTPAPIVAQLNAAINAALSDPEVKAAFEADGATILGGSSAAFKETWLNDTKRLGAIAKELGLKAN